jgi:hypothetical protein
MTVMMNTAVDPEKNSDIFYKEISDGINVISFGFIKDFTPLVIVGGNCSIQVDTTQIDA